MEKKKIEKVPINVVVIGPRQSGKRSIINRILQLYDDWKRGRAEHSYDKWKEDLASGKPLDTLYYTITTKRYYFTFTHGIGHPRFVSSLSKRPAPDVAFLVVSAVAEEFDKSRKEIIEQLDLMSNFGISNVIVIVTKMDLIHYDQAQFSAIETFIETEKATKRLRLKFVKYVPVSSTSDLNLAPKPELAGWYTGPDFMSLLNTIPRKITLADRPLRFPVEEVYRIAGVGYCASGRMFTGRASSYHELSDVIIAPEQYVARITGIENHHDEMTVDAGTSVGMYFKGLGKELRKGQVVGHRYNCPPKPVKSFTVLLYINRLPNTFVVDQLHPVKCHHALVECKITDLIGKVDPQYGTIERLGEDKKVESNEYIIVRFEPTAPVCVELYSEFSELGRVTIQNGDEPVLAKGLVTDLTNVEAPLIFATPKKNV
jgi:elongation factor 1-alpha